MSTFTPVLRVRCLHSLAATLVLLFKDLLTDFAPDLCFESCGNCLGGSV
jgi:hypothetical protein